MKQYGCRQRTAELRFNRYVFDYHVQFFDGLAF